MRFAVNDNLETPLSEEELLQGGAVLLLLLDPHEWMHRRVEKVTFVDQHSLKRRVSVDLTLPGSDVIIIEKLPFVPVAFLDKRVLIDFDARDEAGSSVPVLTKQENSRIAWAALARAAEHSLPGGLADLDEQTLQDLRMIVGGGPARALQALERIERRASVHGEAAVALMKSWAFRSLAYDLATRFLLFLAIDDEPGARRVLKFSYVTPLQEPTDLRSRLRRVASQFGWIPAEFDVAVPAIGEASSYHCEFAPPAELEVVASELMVETVDEIYVNQGDTAGPRAHVYIGQEVPTSEGWLTVWLRAPRTGLLRAAFVVTGVTLLLIVFFLDEKRITQIESNQPVAILLTIPALVSSFIVRPGEHGLATTLLTGIRLAVGLSGLSALAGAAFLVAQVSDGALLNSWRVLAAIAGICFLSCVVAFMGFGPVGRIGQARFPVTALDEDEDNGEES
ncbi:MAG: hypothetical protein ACRDKT_15020 [Actinomycetota bacterium]